MQDLIDFLQTNSALVVANPIAFLTSAVLFGGSGFVIGRYFLTERIANLESRIARRDDEIAALKQERLLIEAEPMMMDPVLGTSAVWKDAEIKLPVESHFNGTEEKIRLSQA